MTGDRTDGSRKGMRAIPLTQRQRKQLKPAETPARLTDAVSPHASGHKRRAPRPRRRATSLDAAVSLDTSSATSEATTTQDGASATRAARPTAPKPAATKPTATTAALRLPARPSRRPAETPPAPPRASALPAADAPVPRRTQRRPPPSITPVSPLDLVDTAPLVAPASLLRAQPTPHAPAAEPELAETTRLKLPRGANGARRAAAPTEQTEQIDAVVTTPLTSPVERAERVDTTPLPPPLDMVDTAQLGPFAPAPELAATSRLNVRRVASKARPPAGALDDVETAPLGLPSTHAIDEVDTTQLPPASALDTRSATQLATPIDAVDTTQLAPLTGTSGEDIEPLFAPPDLPAAPYLPALTYLPVDAVDTTQLPPPVDAVDTTRLSSPLEDADTTLLPPRVTPSAAGPGSSPSSPSDPGSPRRVKVRVRRKRAGGLSEDSDPARAAVQAPASDASASQLADEETAILPALQPLTPAPQAAASSLTLNIIAGSQTSQLVTAEAPATPPAPDLPETTWLTSPASAPEEPAPDTSPLAAAPANEPPEAPVAAALIAEEPVADAPTLEAPAVQEPVADAADADANPLAPPEPAVAEVAAADEHSGVANAAPVSPAPTAPAVTPRKLPTLAVMAALASRAEARAEAEAEAEAREDDHERDHERDEEQGSEPGVALADEDTDKLRIPSAAAPAGDASASDFAPSLWASAADTVPPQPAPTTTTDAGFLPDLRAMLGGGPPTQPRPRATRPGASVRQTPSLAANEDEDEASAPDAIARDGRASGPSWRMWWQTAPTSGPRGRDGRPPTMSAPSAPSMPSAPRDWRPRPESQPLPRARAARWAGPGSREIVQESTGWGGYTEPASDPSALLVWTGGAQAALAGMGALIAALALLNGGPRALGVFAWAISFALLAGIGAGLGHLAWRARQPKRATLAITLSHLGLMVWALALLGPLPALMALVPVTLALTLRGLGRMVTAITATTAGAFYLVTLTLSVAGQWPFPPVAIPPLILTLLNSLLISAGVALGALALISLYSAGERERARTRAIVRDAAMATGDLEALRAQTEDDADALRQALSAALRGRLVPRMRARGALSPLAEQVNITGERLAELSYDREARKRLEGATRRLIRNMERAWLGLSWEWPEASGVILDDLIALLRTPPPHDGERLPAEPTSTGQVVAPHLYRAGQPGVSIPSQPLTAQPGLWPDRSLSSQPSGVWPAFWPSDPEPAAPGVDPFALPPAPRWGEAASDGQAFSPRPPSAPSFPYQPALDDEDMRSGPDAWRDANGANSYYHGNGDHSE